MKNPERFSPLLGADLKVSLQFDLPRNVQAKKNMTTRKLLENTIRGDSAHPGQMSVLPYASSPLSLKNIIDGDIVKILFPGEPCQLAEEVKLIFWRKFDYVTRLPRLWLMVAREGEERCFSAFSSPQANEKNDHVVTLWYLSKTKKEFPGFKPLFVKIKSGDLHFYFRVDAGPSGARDILVEARAVPEDDAPVALRTSISVN